MMKTKTESDGGDRAVELPDFDLAAFTPYRVALAAQLLSDMLAGQFRQKYDISSPDWKVLVHLVHSGGASVRDIESSVVMEKSKVSRTATRLERRGLIAKTLHPKDKRLVQLSLTTDGVAMMADLLPIATEMQARIAEKLGDGFAEFDAGLTTIIADFAGHS